MSVHHPGVSDPRFNRLTWTRTLVPVIEITMPSGRVRSVHITGPQLLELLGDAAHIIAKRATAELRAAAAENPTREDPR